MTPEQRFQEAKDKANGPAQLWHGVSDELRLSREQAEAFRDLVASKYPEFSIKFNWEE